MGEATYTLEIQGIKKEDLPKIKKFILQGRKAEDYWQKHRDMELTGNRGAFWFEFKKKFPQVVEYLSQTGLVDGDCNNELAGRLDFNDCCDNMSLKLSEDGVLTYTATVWHFATWEYFVDYIMKKYGGTAGTWWSDEHNYYDHSRRKPTPLGVG
jgi:hypothetical protein